jgi:hypothetical protein
MPGRPAQQGTYSVRIRHDNVRARAIATARAQATRAPIPQLRSRSQPGGSARDNIGGAHALVA